LNDLSQSSAIELLRLHARIGKELRDRGLTRSSNNPVGDFAEQLFCRAFGWRMVNNSTRAIDAIGPDQTRYQIKARRMTRHRPSRQLSAIRGLERCHFDFVAGVLFDEGYSVIRAAIIPHAVIVARATYQELTNSYRFHLRDDVWEASGVRDVTAELRSVEL
jgi:hypothetical protein